MYSKGRLGSGKVWESGYDRADSLLGGFCSSLVAVVIVLVVRCGCCDRIGAHRGLCWTGAAGDKAKHDYALAFAPRFR